MKKNVFLFFSVLVIIITLQNCKVDPPIHPLVHYNDADSLYTGTQYTITKPHHFPSITNPAASSMTYEGVELGRRLFYDVKLSVNKNKSCGSCHNLQYALSDAGMALSVNEFGPTKRNAPAIQNLLWAPVLFWDGRQPTLADQAADAYEHELGMIAPNAVAYVQSDSNYVRLFKKAFGRPGDVTANKIYLAVQQFMMTAISSNSKFDRVQLGIESFTPSEQNGFTMFLTEKGDCFHCHNDGFSNIFTDNKFHNNGLDSVFLDLGRGAINGVSTDIGRFRTPSLRNIAVTGPYMHDGRYKTLQQVINFYSDSIKVSATVDPVMVAPIHANGGLHLTADEKQDMINFLNTLTDDSMMVNPALKNPF